MSTPDKKSHWASLANVLGAKVPPEPKQFAAKQPQPVAPPVAEVTPPPPAVEEPAPVVEEPVAAAPVAPPAKSPPKTKVRDNWGKVLGALGLRAPDPEPEVETPPPAPVAAPSFTTPSYTAPPASAFSAPPAPSYTAPPAPPPAQAILPPANPLPKNLWELLGDKAPEPTIEYAETQIFSGEVGGNDLLLGEDRDEEDEEEAPKSRLSPRGPEPVRAVGEFDRPRRRDEEESSDRPRRRRRRRRRRGEAGVESAESSIPADDYVDAPTSRRHVDEDDDEPLDEEFAPPVESYDADEIDAPPARSSEADEDGERPRRRRRRRRGRGRSAETQAPAPVSESVRDTGYSDDEEGDDEEFAPPPRREPARSAAPPRGRRPERVEVESTRASHDDDEDEDVVDHGEHRSIPTWQDAVGLVVSTNMEARAKNPHSSRGGRGRGGRGRGGRGGR